MRKSLIPAALVLALFAGACAPADEEPAEEIPEATEMEEPAVIEEEPAPIEGEIVDTAAVEGTEEAPAETPAQ